MKLTFKSAIVAACIALTAFGSLAASASPAQAGGMRNRNGAAIAAGILGVLALGAIATAGSGYGSPAYAAPAYSGHPYGPQTYYPAARHYRPNCYIAERRYYDNYGDVIVRRTRVCE
ncbi:hypothetical protein [Microvirga tunisiensis]|uniref:Lectin-like protein BA14k n=1 Tax=Microvirga tunisiensis TaxID=2108360 RepID=A0A5N7MTY8_9HYPH|nr:hypothetical protein [Microvirga tunisiensis]MPR12184.1 hypothetical protein [Microvirga tunisiensis]MPR30130.1 hypothetical protein [Microvirga tunisiensis]